MKELKLVRLQFMQNKFKEKGTPEIIHLNRNFQGKTLLVHNSKSFKRLSRYQITQKLEELQLAFSKEKSQNKKIN